jgi:peptide/nickel transport system substrate-binding protein
MHDVTRCDDERPGRTGSRIRRRTFLRLAGAGAALAGAYLRGAGTEARAAGKPLIVGANLLIRNLDPGRGIEPIADMINHATYDSLVTFAGADLKSPKPSLAERWTTSDDGKTYTFALRPNVKFASGNPMTSTDVKWSLDRIVRYKLLSAFLLSDVVEVQAPDPATVVVRLRSSNPGIVPILSSPNCGVVDSKVAAAHGGDDPAAYLNTHSAGTGPYTLASYVHDEEVVLVRNPAYWGVPATLDRIVVRNITEPATQQLEVQRGSVDIALGITPDQVPGLRKAPGVTVATSLAATTFTLMMNMDPKLGGPFATPKVQQAVRYALDYRGILAVAGPGSVRLAGYIPTTLPGALDPSEAIQSDPAKARALLKEAGVGPVSGTLTFASDEVEDGVKFDLLAQKIQADLANVGIAVKLNGLERALALGQYRRGQPQLWFSGWSADYPDGSDFLVYLPGGAAGARAHWMPDSSPEAAQLTREGQAAIATPDPRLRALRFQEVQRKLVPVCPFIPLFQPAVPYAYRSNVRNVTFNGVWAVDFAAVQKT